MGYRTEFLGAFTIEPTLHPAHRSYLVRFAETRRMKRHPARTELLPDPVRMAVGLPVGPDGAYYVGAVDDFSDSDPSVIEASTPHAPFTDSLYCGWTPTPDGMGLEWSGLEKFYDYDRWLVFLIEHFLRPWGYRLSGRVDWQGDDWDDRGRIFARDNLVRAVEARIEVPDPIADW